MEITLDEYVAPVDNKDVIKTLSEEQPLMEQEYKKIDYQIGKYKMILEFPITKHENEDILQQEIVNILRCELQEQMKNNS